MREGRKPRAGRSRAKAQASVEAAPEVQAEAGPSKAAPAAPTETLAEELPPAAPTETLAEELPPAAPTETLADELPPAAPTETLADELPPETIAEEFPATQPATVDAAADTAEAWPSLESLRPAVESQVMQLDFGVIEGLVEALAEPRPIPPSPPAVAAPPASWDDDTAVRRRLASVYLRTGALSAARVELESLGGRNLLEGHGLLDLAEVRWRTGDRARAGEAAGAYLDAGGSDGLAFVIVAEAAAEAGRHDEARGHLAEAASRLEDLVRAYAGMRTLVEPEPPLPPESVSAPESLAQPEATAGGPDMAPEPAPGPGDAVAESPELDEAPGPQEPPAATPDPEIASAANLLESGEALRAAVHLGLALRTGPISASAVLAAIGDRHDAALELVRGDALRLLGRDEEAAAAYRAASAALAAEEGRGS